MIDVGIAQQELTRHGLFDARCRTDEAANLIGNVGRPPTHAHVTPQSEGYSAWPARLVFGLVVQLLTWSALAPVAAVAADWPQFLGPTRDGTYPGADLAAAWPKEGPPLVWQTPVGQGFSGPVVQGGKLVVFHRLGDKEVVDCLNAADGKSFWRFDYPTSYQDDFGFDEGPRATPTLAGDRVYTFGAEGALHCLDLASGKKLWSVQVKDQFHAGKGFFGIACSPLVESGKVLINAGGTEHAGIVAFDAGTGRLAWKSTADEASYSSPVSAMLHGQPHALFFSRSGLVSVAPDSGKVQFEYPWRSRSHASVNAATPLVIGEQIFLSASYETGAVLLNARTDQLAKVWSSDEVLSNHYATSVHRDGFLFGFHGRQESGPSLRCVELQTGKVRWSVDGFGAGSLVRAADQLLVLREDGQLLLLQASPKAYSELGRAQVLPKGVRAYPAVASGFIYARSKDKLACLDLRRH